MICFPICVYKLMDMPIDNGHMKKITNYYKPDPNCAPLREGGGGGEEEGEGEGVWEDEGLAKVNEGLEMRHSTWAIQGMVFVKVNVNGCNKISYHISVQGNHSWSEWRDT